MASNDREIKLTLKAQTTGASEIENLAKQVEDLAKQGGDAAAPLREISQELRSLANQQNLIASWQQFETELKAVSAASDTAKNRLATLTQTTAERKAAVDAAALAEREAATVLESATAKQNAATLSQKEARAALLALKAEIAAAGNATKDQESQLEKLTTTVLQYRAEAAAAAVETTKAKAAYKESSDALKTLENEYGKAESAMAGVQSETTKLAESETRLTAQLTEMLGTLDKAGVDVLNFGQHQIDAAKRVEQLNTQLQDVPAYLKDMAQAFDTLATKEQAAARAEKEYQDYLAQEAALQAKAEKAERDRRMEFEAWNRAQEQFNRAEYINFWNQAIDAEERQSAALKEAANAAKQAAAEMDKAFSTIGIKSITGTKDEIDKVRQALDYLKTSGKLSGQEIADATAAAERRIKELEGTLNSAGKASGGFGESIRNAFSQFGPATLVFNGITGAINLMMNALTGIPKVTAAFESLNRGLVSIFGSSSAAAKEFEFLKSVASTTGQGIEELAKAYTNLSAATKGTGVEGNITREVFRSVSAAMGLLGKSSAETELALRAVSQMASKGVVSMEELRQQLGEALPQAFTATASGLGITTQQLNELVSSGKLTVNEVFPALIRGLNQFQDLSKQNDTLNGQWQRLTNSVKLYGNEIGEPIMKPMLKFVQYTAAGLASIVEHFVLAGKAAVALGDVIFNWRTDGLEFFSEEVDKAHARIKDLAGVAPQAEQGLYQMAQAAQASGKAYVDLGNGQQILASQVIAANDGFIKQMVTITEAQKKAAEHETAMRKATEATRAAGEQSVTAAAALGDEADRRATATKVALDNAAALEQLLAAEKVSLNLMFQEEEALKRKVAALGDAGVAEKKQLEDLQAKIETRKAEVTGLEAQTKANQLNAEAQKMATIASYDNSAALENLRQHYLDLTNTLTLMQSLQKEGLATQEDVNKATEEAQKAAKLYADAAKDEGDRIREIAQLSGNEKQARDAAITALQLQLRVLTEAGKARTDEAVKLERQLVLLQEERLRLEDNSGAVQKYAAAYNEAKAKVDDLNAQKARGVDVSGKLASAEQELARVTGIYKDALKDLNEKIAANLSLAKSKIELEQADIKVMAENLRTQVALAQAKGDNAAATRLQNQLNMLEAQSAMLSSQAKREEAKATLESNAAKRKELETSGQLTDAKRMELEASDNTAMAKLREADAADVAAQRTTAFQYATDELGNSLVKLNGDATTAASGIDSIGASADAATSKLTNMASATEKAASAASRSGGNQPFQAGNNMAYVLGQRGINLTADQQSTFDKEYANAISSLNGKYAGRQWSTSLEQQKTEEAIKIALSMVQGAIKTSIPTSRGYQGGYAGASGNFGIKNVYDYGTQAIPTDLTSVYKEQNAVLSALNAGATKTADSMHTVRIQLFGESGKQTTLYAADNASAQQLINILQQSGLRAS